MGENNKKYKITLKNCIKFTKTILVHKWYVFYFCCKCGIPLRGLVHDLSKFSPAEFLTNVKFYRSGISPIDIQKKEVGYSFSWLHHKSHNPHHYEYWTDKYDNGCYITRMPYKYIVECLCDFLGASMAYNASDKKHLFRSEEIWWSKQRYIRNMHPDNTSFLDNIIFKLADIEKNYENDKRCNQEINRVLNKDYLKKAYDTILRKSELPVQVKIRQPEE